MLTTCADRDIAIQVRWTPAAEPHLIEILNTPFPNYRHLGAAHFSGDKSYTQFGPKSTASASLTYATAPDNRGRIASLRTDARTGRPVSGPSRAVIWTVLADDTIVPVVEDSGCRYALYPVVWGEDNSIFIVANYIPSTHLPSSPDVRKANNHLLPREHLPFKVMYSGHTPKPVEGPSTRSAWGNGSRNSISIVGTADQYGGMLTITLDGVESTFNRYSSQIGPNSYDPQCSTTLFQKSGLAPTHHTLTVNHTSDSNGGSSDGNQFFEWQYLQYYQTEEQGPVKSKSNIAAIAGGVGGGVGLIIILALLWWYFKRKQNREFVFPLDLADDGAPTPGLANAIVEPFVPPPPTSPREDPNRRPRVLQKRSSSSSFGQEDPNRRQSRVLQKRSSSSSFGQMASTGPNVTTIPYLDQKQQPTGTSTPSGEQNTHIRRSSIAKGPSADDSEFNPYALATGPRPTSMTDFTRPADRPLSGDFSIAGSSFYQNPPSSRGPSSQAPLIQEKGAIGVMNPDAPGPSSPPPGSPRLPPEVMNQLPALSEADMARLAAQVATMLQPGAATSPAAPARPQRNPPRGDADDAPPEYSQVARPP
ncbi:hypothetical protein FRC01_003073 [Tulasnella sp. 417]|nr:hypothetical protein FRC01_003073 [Tulasnella sp. 417]